MLTENIANFLGYFQSLSYSKKSLKALKSRLGAASLFEQKVTVSPCFFG